MNNIEQVEQFYKRNDLNSFKNIKNGIGHFNVFSREDAKAKFLYYNKRNYFKITLLKGKIKIFYADKVLQSDKYALMFSDPLIPYAWEPLEKNQSGFFCIFSETFFQGIQDLRKYPVFQPTGNKVFLLDKEALFFVENIYRKMFEEIKSDYFYKSDVLRNLVSELIHFSLKRKPAYEIDFSKKDKSTKIASLFLELLERQFPIKSPYERFTLNRPSDFSKNLNIHTNHLNKILKATFGKTTSEMIEQRILQEAKILLKNTSWNICDIAFSLGFNEASYFTNFFKKREKVTPKNYKKQ